MNKKIFKSKQIISILLGAVTCISFFSMSSTAHAEDRGMTAICVPQPKFAYLFKNLSNFQSNISPLNGVGSCQWNVNGIQIISFEMTISPGKYAQQRTLDNLTHADPFNKYVPADPSHPSVMYKNHFAISVCATEQLACVEHIVINSDTLLDISDITQSTAALDYFSIRRNLETLGMFVIDQYNF